jgi:succinate-semialdehyde dehydrogenase/glutarate-semialdehyde dehydrogenase
LWTGGQAPSHLSGFFFEPTIITGATSDMTVATEADALCGKFD